MKALEDFEAYWISACEAIGGTATKENGIHLRAPQGGPPTNGILRANNLEEEIPEWKQRGAPFSVTARTDGERTAALAAGLVPNPPFVLVEGNIIDLGEPDHEIGSSVADFVDVQMVAHDIPPFVRDMVLAGWAKNQAEGIMHLFVAYDDGPAGCAALFTGGGNAGMYAFGVLPEKRRKGVAKSLAAACVAKARDLGLTHAVAATTPDGFALAQAFGAKKGPELQQFFWFP